MLRLIAEAWVAAQGLYRLMRFQDGWEIDFDFSAAGFWRSFGAALVALPFIALILAGAWYIEPSGFNGFRFLVLYTLSWLIFPLAAGLAVTILGVRPNFAVWVILHNWAVVFLYGLQAVFFLLHTAGLINGDVLSLFLLLYGYARLLIHWRIAYATLGLPTITSALATAVPVLAGELALTAVSYAFAASATQAG
jgi:hypothetical protein